MNEKNRKIQNGEEILQQIKEMRSEYESTQVDKVEEELSFLDKINKLIQLILGDNTIDVYQALDKESLERWKKRRFSRWLKNLFTGNFKNTLYFILLATITLFLVSEALSFYAIDNIISTKTYIKAILTEVCFIFLSGYRAIGKIQTIWINFLRAGIFSLMMFVISSQSISVGTGKISENTAIQQQIVLIEKQIIEKAKELAYYEKKDWPKNFTRTTIAKQKLVDKLIALKEKQEGGKNMEISKVEQYKMYGKAAFRVLLLFISVLVTRRIFTF